MNLWESPLGSFHVQLGDNGISKVQVDSTDGDQPIAKDLTDALNEHVYGRPSSLELNLEAVTSPIAQLTLAKLLEIPYGEIRSYAWVAKEIGHPAAVRPVANAVAGNPIPILIPCHRVVRSDGHIGNYSLGPEMKLRLLEFEGLDVPRMGGFASRGIRFLGDKETNTYHLPSCQLAIDTDLPALHEMSNLDQASASHFEPCRRCRPV